MKFKQFALYNIASGVAWCVSITFVGYFLGEKIPNIDKFLLPIIAFACTMSLVPIVVEVFKRKRKTIKKL